MSGFGSDGEGRTRNLEEEGKIDPFMILVAFMELAMSRAYLRAVGPFCGFSLSLWNWQCL